MNPGLWILKLLIKLWAVENECWKLDLLEMLCKNPSVKIKVCKDKVLER